ncbi:MAG: hypothetical protein JNM27_16605 [Leptospirales bacterium]|nr:hypothetical protein [Leptospirales bacterium]
MKKTLLAIVILILTVSSVFAQPKDADKQNDTPAPTTAPKLEGLKFTGLPLISFSTDDGIGKGVRVYATYYEEGYAPFKFQAYGQYYKTTFGYEYHEGSLDMLNFLGLGLRLRLNAGLERTLNAQWYGYGNYHDLRRIKKIKSGEIPINENTPPANQRDYYQYDDDITLNTLALTSPSTAGLRAFNPSRRILRESQNKYFYYDRIKPFANLSTENFIGETNFKWFVGFRGQSYKIQSYQNDKENGNTVPNIKTLIDNEQPFGYDATEKRRFVNGLRGALAYDSRPRQRESNPNGGIFTDIHVEGVGKGTGSHYSYTRTTATFRQYIDVAPSFFNSYDRELVFAYRLLGQKTHGNVPFFEAGRIYTMRENAEGLGGNGGVRGYSANQFVDRVMTIANAEVRLTTFKIGALGGMDFVILGYHDEGRVAPTVKEIDGKGWHKANGGGIRIVWQRNTVINISYGRSQYGSNGNFSFNHLF